MLARLLFAALFVTAAAPAQTPGVFTQIDGIVAALSEITGWQVHRKVPSEMLRKEDFSKYVSAHMKDASTDKDTRAEELTLKMFGLVPQDFNLARETADLISEQAAAFYDYKKKRLYIIDSTNEGAEQRLALVHELAHALADQQHPLGKYLSKGSPDDDAATAREAVMEGQANWLAWAYEAKRAGGKAEVPQRLLERLASDYEGNSPDMPVYASEPLYIRESLVFPYEAGIGFVDAVYRKLGPQGFEEVFARPPRSTQQIMHPEEYFKDTAPTDPGLASLDSLPSESARNFRLLAEGSFGEFDHSVLLRQYMGETEGRAAARHWRGGAYRLYEHKRGKYPVLSFASYWDSAEAARTFFDLYQGVLKGKWKKMDVTTRTAAEVAGVGDSGRFSLRISGTLVQSLEGFR